MNAQLLEEARQLRDRTRGWLVDERPITNVEMWLLGRLAVHEWQERQERDGCCCEDGPDDRGKCRNNLGACPVFEAARKLVRRDNRERGIA